MDRNRSVSVTVVERVAEHNGVDPTALEPRLHDVIDPEALDALVGSGADPSLTVEFTYKGCAVTVHGPERVEVTPDPSVDEVGEPSTRRPICD